MAANTAAFVNYLDTTFNFARVLAEELATQGLDSFPAFVDLSDEDVKEICTTIRKPGGTIQNPAYVAQREQYDDQAAADPTTPVPHWYPQTIANPGIPIPLPKEKILRQICYLANHFVRIQRNFDQQSCTTARLASLWRYKIRVKEEGKDEPKLPEKLSNINNIRQVIENVENYLRVKRGVNGIFLLYVIRESVEIPDGDPGFALPTIDDEMIRRAPHTTDSFHVDSATVWNVVRHVTHDGPGWTWVSSYNRSQNGRDAFIALRSHYQGDAYRNNLKIKAENTMSTARYDGKSRNFTYEKYIERLNQAFVDMAEAGEAQPEDAKVRKFLNGLLADNLTSAKEHNLADIEPDGKLHDFKKASEYVARVMDNQHNIDSGSKSRNVYSMDSRGRGGQGRGQGRGRGRGQGRGRGRGRGRGGSGSSTTLTDGYYSPEEWGKLTHEQQQKVRDLRTSRDKRRGVQAVERSTRPRIEHETPAAAVTVAGIGAQMSQRSIPSTLPPQS